MRGKGGFSTMTQSRRKARKNDALSERLPENRKRRNNNKGGKEIIFLHDKEKDFGPACRDRLVKGKRGDEPPKGAISRKMTDKKEAGGSPWQREKGRASATPQGKAEGGS